MKKDSADLLRVIVIFFLAVDAFLWLDIFSGWSRSVASIYFLNVGQGDSSLVIFPSPVRGQPGVKLLIDGGPMNGLVKKNLGQILPASDRYIDLVMISHPQTDHFGGLLELLEDYDIGAVLTSSEDGSTEFWKEFERIRKKKGIPRILVSEGDRIVYGNSEFSVLSPTADSGDDMNEISIAGILEILGIKTFFGGDIGFKKESELARKYDLDVDILKVNHHGSKYSSGGEFLREVSPIFSVIEVGKNSYGHPTEEALGRLENYGSKIFRTDVSGFIRMVIEGGKLRVYTQN